MRLREKSREESVRPLIKHREFRPRARHRSEEADERLDEASDVETGDAPPNETELPAEPHPRPTTDAAGADSTPNPDDFSRTISR
jgi:hypothetical protein